VPEGDQDHGGVAAAVSVALGGIDQLLNLALVQVLPDAQRGIRPPQRRLPLRSVTESNNNGGHVSPSLWSRALLRRFAFLSCDAFTFAASHSCCVEGMIMLAGNSPFLTSTSLFSS
jgi:hypothetical protein